MALVLSSLVSLSVLLGAADVSPPSAVEVVGSPAGAGGGLSSLPPQPGGGRLVTGFFPPSHAEPAHVAFLPSPSSAALRDPQQLAHRTAGSRSPPYA